MRCGVTTFRLEEKQKRPIQPPVQQAVWDLPALQQEIGRRKGFKPISDKEIKYAVNEGRP